jgi:putative membrane protein
MSAPGHEKGAGRQMHAMRRTRLSPPVAGDGIILKLESCTHFHRKAGRYRMLWVKALHIIAVICWFAALFYLPRLLVYHSMAEDATSRERFKVMERKLYRGIMTPSMIATLLFGLWLIHYNPAYYLQAGWMHVKLASVVLLIAYHFACGYFLRQFRDDQNVRSHKFFRVFNEAPVLLLVLIVIMVVVKPTF